jgi:hypothetical protein
MDEPSSMLVVRIASMGVQERRLRKREQKARQGAEMEEGTHQVPRLYYFRNGAFIAVPTRPWLRVDARIWSSASEPPKNRYWPDRQNLILPARSSPGDPIESPTALVIECGLLSSAALNMFIVPSAYFRSRSGDILRASHPMWIAERCSVRPEINFRK